MITLVNVVVVGVVDDADTDIGTIVGDNIGFKKEANCKNKMKCHWYSINTLKLLYLTLALAFQRNNEMPEKNPFISKLSIRVNRLCFVVDTGDIR